MKNDRRHYPRYNVNIEADIVSESGKDTGYVVEISVDGLRFQSHKSITPDSMVTLVLPRLDTTARGTVLWTIEAVLAGLPAYLMGLKIHSLAKDGTEAVSFTERTELIEDILLYAKND